MEGYRKFLGKQGLSRVTISVGIKELKRGIINDGRIRKAGGGRKPLEKDQPGIVETVVTIADGKGDPQTSTRWTSLSMEHIAKAAAQKGYTISTMSVYRILKTQGFALKANKI